MPGLFRRFRPPLGPHPPTKLLVLLHGLGSDENDMLGAAQTIDPSYAVCALRAPFEYEYGGNSWFSLSIDPRGVSYDMPQAIASRDLLATEVAALSNELNIPESSTVIGGFSQGAMMTAGVLIANRNRYAGGLLMSGAVLPEFIIQSNAQGSEPILIQHGTQDTVVPVSAGRQARDRLQALGFQVEYKEYQMPHTVNPESLADAQTWLGQMGVLGGARTP